ncbi:MAG TPA: pyrimidine dimer DNA glycosylase/endonuclease V [bacterium]|nr:pyrimidine dimer DNA glycosylase/endonuclease V [bacterium]
MRLWSIHPKYLDKIGLVALWREALLAKKVLEGKTKGYKNHPQLERFKKSGNPIKFINKYLEQIYNEAKNRGYNFDPTKFKKIKLFKKINITTEQLNYEMNHLFKKIKKRAPRELKKIEKKILTNPIFKSVRGKIEDWEKIK